MSVKVVHFFTVFLMCTSLSADLNISCEKYSSVCDGETTGIRVLEPGRYVNYERDRHDSKKIYRDTTTGRQWSLRTVQEFKHWKEYFATKFYVSILGPKYVADLIIFKSEEGEVYIGSPFLDNYQEAQTLCHDSTRLTAIRCAIKHQAVGSFKMAALMMLLGESDASMFNLGFVKDAEGSLHFAKIDHDHSEFWRREDKSLQLDAYMLMHIPLEIIGGSQNLIGGASLEELEGLETAFGEISLIDWRAITKSAWSEWVKYFPGCPLETLTNTVGQSFEKAAKYARGLKVMRAIQSKDMSRIDALVKEGHMSFSEKYDYIHPCDARGTNLVGFQCVSRSFQLSPEELAKLLGITLLRQEQL